jgi:hypothetical protein
MKLGELGADLGGLGQRSADEPGRSGLGQIQIIAFRRGNPLPQLTLVFPRGVAGIQQGDPFRPGARPQPLLGCPASWAQHP